MSRKTEMKKPLAIAIGAALATTFGAATLANADANPFAMTALGSGYMMVADAGEGKCGEGKCGGDKGDMMQNLDANGDGQVTRSEFTSHYAGKFDEVDQNQDDQITRSEMESAHKGKEGSRGGDKGGEGKCGGDKGGEGKCGGDKGGEGKCGGDKGGEGKCGGDKGERMSEMFDLMDSDGNAGISRAEHDAYWEAKFNAIDTDGDGRIDEEDMKAAHEKMRADHEQDMEDDEEDM